MKPNSNDLLQRILDYHMRLDSDRQREDTRKLLEHDLQAQQLDAALRKSLAPLSEWAVQTPPAGLAVRTYSFIHDQESRTRPVLLENPSDERASRGRSWWVISNLRDVIAVAASLAIIFLAALPSTRYARQIARQNACASQMRQAGVAMAHYAQDANGAMPYVPIPAGAVWWQVGQQGQQNHSNTRNLYLLVKGGYLPADAFVCPGNPNAGQIRIAIPREMMATLQDFAERTQVNYSLRLMIQPRNLSAENASIPLLSDQNPIFIHFDSDRLEEIDLQASKQLLRSNSPNHNGRGLNLLHPDGHVRFSTDRNLDSSDDIFTIRNVTQYRGTEQPDQNDVFIAP